MRALHTADWHLRESQYGDKKRGLEFFEAALRLVEVASKLKEQGAIDCIINGGDILDKKRPPSLVMQQLMAIHDQLVYHNIPMFTITGNHDLDDPPWISLLPQFPGKGIISIDGLTLDFKGVKIRGVSALSKKGVQEEIESLNEPIDIVVWHGAIKESMSFTDGTNLSINDFIDYTSHINTKFFLLGDIHKRQYYDMMAPDGRRVICGYPGTLEMASTSENPNKSCTIIDTETYEMTEHQLVSRPYLEIDLKDEESMLAAVINLTNVNTSVLVSLQYYPDDRLDLFNKLNVVLADRSSRFNDIIRYSSEGVETKQEYINIEGNVTLQTIIEADYAQDPLMDMMIELSNKNSNPEKIMESYVNSKLEQIA
jgi:DNA repair exonuclease SbcCD nuclease subunit